MELLALIMSSLALAKSQQDYHLGVINPDRIYFNDGGQRYPYLNVLPVSPSPQGNVNSNIGDNQLYDQGGRFPVNMIPQMGPNLNVGNMNANALTRPSQDLEPPRQPPLGNAQPTAHPTVLPQTADRFADISDEATNRVGLQDDVPTPPPTKISLALTQFGINLMKIVHQQSRNAVVSPYSIGTLLALLQQGSLGASQQQISNALQMNPLEAADGFKNLTDSLKKRQSHNIMKVGNGLFLAEAFSINPAFKRVALQDFGSDVATIKFSRPEQAATKINNWVASKTNNKINKLLNADSIDASTQLTLVNAVYFKGLWQVKFRPEATLAKSFYQYRDAPKMANFMRMRRYFRTDYDSSIDSQVLILPFEGDQYSLVVILPSPSSTVTSALAAMTPEKLLTYQNYTPKEVALELPKFSVKAETNLVSVFQKLGITNIFSSTSELSGLGNYRDFAPQVSSALHSALLSVDEEGGTAAAATSFGVVALSYDDPSVTFRADRPFIAVLWDRIGSVPLFMAKIEDPY